MSNENIKPDWYYIHNGNYFEIMDRNPIDGRLHGAQISVYHSDEGDGTEHLRHGKKEAEKVAKLIAAAPELLEALILAYEQFIRQGFKVIPNVDDHMSRINSAIKKATL